MSKKKKRTKRWKKRNEERLKKKHARQALWATRAGTQANRRASGERARAGRLNRRHTHALGHCGNIGCKRCNPNEGNDATLADSNTPQGRKLFTSPRFRGLR